jgi:hypothetical protein
VDYTKGKYDLYAKRFVDSSSFAKEQQGDVRFGMNFHAVWYASVILCKSHPTTEMKSINWDYLFKIDLPVVRKVEYACGECMSPQSCISTVIGMRRSFLSCMQPFTSTTQPRPSIRPFKADPSMLSMLTLQVFLDSLMIIF